MRAFIAISLPKEIRDALAGLQEELKTAGADIKWVEPQNIHLTLKFLGERDEKKINRMAQALEETAQDNYKYRISIGSIGCFPKIESPRVIWAGLTRGDSQTRKIARELEEKIAKLGIPKENRAFSSHITIGRFRTPENNEKLIQELNRLEKDTGELKLEAQITKIALYKSTLTSTGPIYELLKEASLKTT